ncbi:GNAT family N-acetyltransferase [Oceanobacillus sp. FSL W8-0428]|uniref:GNAT family N-acetyltransferase n=1 Tax=Oceanobacillus sp. FSL W8-0428 TaxID=2921715 RepID=UPI0030FC5A3B
MELETERLKVIPCTEETVEIAINQKYDSGPQISTHLKKLNEDPSLLYWGPWFVVRKSDGSILGDIGFKGKPDKNRVVEAGYGFLESYWGNGYATEAMEVLIQWAFKTSKVDRVIAETLQDNYGSIRVLQKLGMKKISSTETMIHWEIGNSD